VTNPPNSLVFAIDDDASVRKGLARLLRSAGYKSEIFASASNFLARPPHSIPTLYEYFCIKQRQVQHRWYKTILEIAQSLHTFAL